MKSITGEGTFDTEILKDMLDENKQAQANAEKEIVECQDEVEKKESWIAMLDTQYRSTKNWAAEFDNAPLDTRKMILARLIEKITVDKNYNIDIFFYVTMEDFNGIVAFSAM